MDSLLAAIKDGYWPSSQLPHATDADIADTASIVCDSYMPLLPAYCPSAACFQSAVDTMMHQPFRLKHQPSRLKQQEQYSCRASESLMVAVLQAHLNAAIATKSLYLHSLHL